MTQEYFTFTHISPNINEQNSNSLLPDFCQAHSAWRLLRPQIGRSRWRSRRKCSPWRRRWWWCRWSRKARRRYDSCELDHGRLRWSRWTRIGCLASPRRSWWRRGWALPLPRCRSWRNSSPRLCCELWARSQNLPSPQNKHRGTLPQSVKRVVILCVDTFINSQKRQFSEQDEPA